MTRPVGFVLVSLAIVGMLASITFSDRLAAAGFILAMQDSRVRFGERDVTRDCPRGSVTWIFPDPEQCEYPREMHMWWERAKQVVAALDPERLPAGASVDEEDAAERRSYYETMGPQWFGSLERAVEEANKPEPALTYVETVPLLDVRLGVAVIVLVGVGMLGLGLLVFGRK